MSDACRALDYPVISGNVSLYNETSGSGVQPTPAIGGVGILLNVEKRATSAFTRANDTIILIGETRGHLGSSLYLPTLYWNPPASLASPPRCSAPRKQKPWKSTATSPPPRALYAPPTKPGSPPTWPKQVANSLKKINISPYFVFYGTSQWVRLSRSNP